jgi:hypothetical protein
VAGLVVTVGEPSVAVTPIRDGIEKYVSSHAAGAVAVMLASLVNVTVNGLSAWPLAATVTGVVRACELPLAAVEWFQMTSLGVAAKQRVWVEVRALDVYPVA